MATNIVLKRSASADAAPTTSDLELGELALNTYDGKIYMKKTVGGSSSIVNLSGTVAPTSSAFSHTTYKFVASGSTTTFTGSDANSTTLAYSWTNSSILKWYLIRCLRLYCLKWNFNSSWFSYRLRIYIICNFF
jgi:hypothetical protein